MNSYLLQIHYMYVIVEDDHSKLRVPTVSESQGKSGNFE